MTHVKITLGGLAVGSRHAKHIVIHDEILVVPDQGDSIDISALVRCHELISRTGSPRMLRLELFAVGEVNGDTITGTAEPTS